MDRTRRSIPLERWVGATVLLCRSNGKTTPCSFCPVELAVSVMPFTQPRLLSRNSLGSDTEWKMSPSSPSSSSSSSSSSSCFDICLAERRGELLPPSLAKSVSSREHLYSLAELPVLLTEVWLISLEVSEIDESVESTSSSPSFSTLLHEVFLVTISVATSAKGVSSFVETGTAEIQRIFESLMVMLVTR